MAEDWVPDTGGDWIPDAPEKKSKIQQLGGVARQIPGWDVEFFKGLSDVGRSLVVGPAAYALSKVNKVIARTWGGEEAANAAEEQTYKLLEPIMKPRSEGGEKMVEALSKYAIEPVMKPIEKGREYAVELMQKPGGSLIPFQTKMSKESAESAGDILELVTVFGGLPKATKIAKTGAEIAKVRLREAADLSNLEKVLEPVKEVQTFRPREGGEFIEQKAPPPPITEKPAEVIQPAYEYPEVETYFDIRGGVYPELEPWESYKDYTRSRSLWDDYHREAFPVEEAAPRTLTDYLEETSKMLKSAKEGEELLPPALEPAVTVPIDTPEIAVKKAAELGADPKVYAKGVGLDPDTIPEFPVEVEAPKKYYPALRVDGKVYRTAGGHRTYGDIPNSILVRAKEIDMGYVDDTGQFFTRLESPAEYGEIVSANSEAVKLLPPDPVEKTTLRSDPFGIQAAYAAIKKSSRAVGNLARYLEKTGELIRDYNPFVDKENLPQRQRTGVDPDRPVILAEPTDINAAEKILSPHMVFRNKFTLGDNPAIDAFKSTMSSFTNIKNSTAYIKEALRGIPNDSKNIVKAVKPLFDKNRTLLDSWESLKDREITLRRTLSKIPRHAEYERLIRETNKLEKTLEQARKKAAKMNREEFEKVKSERIYKWEQEFAKFTDDVKAAHEQGYRKAIEKMKTHTFEKELANRQRVIQRVEKAMALRMQRAKQIEDSIVRVPKYRKIIDDLKALNEEQMALLPQFEKMAVEHDAIMRRLAGIYPEARVYLHAAGELPADWGIKLNDKEMRASRMMRKYLDQTKKDLEQVGKWGIPVRAGTYMPRIFRELLDDPNTVGVLKNWQSKPTLLRFMPRLPNSRTWIPSAHEAMESYIPLVEHKIAMQPFLDRWRPFVDSLKNPNLKEYMNVWIDKNLTKTPAGFWDRMLNASVAFEYCRLIGLSPSVGFKHLLKLFGTPAKYGFSPSLSGIAQIALVPFQAGMEFAELKFPKFAEMMKSMGVESEKNQLRLFRHFVNQSDLLRTLNEIPGMREIQNRGFKLFRNILSQPVRAVEAFDNGVSVMAGAIKGDVKGINPAIIERAIWETILDCNFRAGWDQPLWQKNPLTRALTMFQMTPYKLAEFKYKLVEDAFKPHRDPATGKITFGKRDAFGTHGGAQLVRYLAIIGVAEAIARKNDTSVLELFAHPPFFRGLMEAKKEFPWIKTEPAEEWRAAESPVVAGIHEMGEKGIWEGLKSHFGTSRDILSDPRRLLETYARFEQAQKGRFSARYDTATKAMLGLARVPGEHDIVEVAKEQRREQRKEKQQLDPLIESYALDGKQEDLRKIIEIIRSYPDEKDQERLAERVLKRIEILSMPDSKWWEQAQKLSPERRAEVFYHKVKSLPPNKASEMIKQAQELKGFASERFEEKLEELMDESPAANTD